MNVISPAERVGRKDPLSTGMLPRWWRPRSSARSTTPTRSSAALDEHDGESPRSSSSRSRTTSARCCRKPGFLERLRELATKHGTVLVFDEVITGFRHGLGGYQAIAGVTPDLTTLGKAMANGWPVSALGGKAELMDLFSTTPGQPAFFAGTFNGHPATARLRSRRSRSSSGSRCTSTSSGSASGPAPGCSRAVRAPRRPGRRVRFRLGVRDLLPRGAGRQLRRSARGTTSTCSSATGAS